MILVQVEIQDVDDDRGVEVIARLPSETATRADIERITTLAGEAARRVYFGPPKEPPPSYLTFNTANYAG